MVSQLKINIRSEIISAPETSNTSFPSPVPNFSPSTFFPIYIIIKSWTYSKRSKLLEANQFVVIFIDLSTIQKFSVIQLHLTPLQVLGHIVTLSIVPHQPLLRVSTRIVHADQLVLGLLADDVDQEEVVLHVGEQDADEIVGGLAGLGTVASAVAPLALLDDVVPPVVDLGGAPVRQEHFVLVLPLVRAAVVGAALVAEWEHAGRVWIDGVLGGPAFSQIGRSSILLSTCPSRHHPLVNSW